MTDVIIAPRVEDPLSDTESVITGGYFQVRASRWNATAGQWVSDAWPAPIPLSGTAVTVKLDASTVPYELYLNYPDGRGGFAERTEFRTVTASGSPLKWEDLTESAGAGGGSTLPSNIEARLLALETLYANVSGGASTLSGITDMTATARTFNTQTSTANMKSYLTAANATHTHGVTDLTATGTPDGTKFLAGDNTWKTVASGVHTHVISDVTSLQAALDAKADVSSGAIKARVAVSGVYAARPATTDPVFFIGPTAPAATGSTAGGGGMVPSLDLWFEMP